MDERRVWVDGYGREHPLCQGLTKAKRPCKADALPNNPFCLTHDPMGNGLSPKQNALRDALRDWRPEV